MSKYEFLLQSIHKVIEANFYELEAVLLSSDRGASPNPTQIGLDDDIYAVMQIFVLRPQVTLLGIFIGKKFKNPKVPASFFIKIPSQ